MYVTSGHDTEIRLTLEAMVDLVNALADSRDIGETADVRGLLSDHEGTDIRIEGRCPMCEPTPAELEDECVGAHGDLCRMQAVCVWCGEDICETCYEDHRNNGDAEDEA